MKCKFSQASPSSGPHVIAFLPALSHWDHHAPLVDLFSPYTKEVTETRSLTFFLLLLFFSLRDCSEKTEPPTARGNGARLEARSIRTIRTTAAACTRGGGALASRAPAQGPALWPRPAPSPAQAPSSADARDAPIHASVLLRVRSRWSVGQLGESTPVGLLLSVEERWGGVALGLR